VSSRRAAERDEKIRTWELRWSYRKVEEGERMFGSSIDI
jgi:hypothetical protein